MSVQFRGFDWNQARAFLATVEAGSLSAAARSLGLTQPTLGRQVAGLEQDLGLLLFERVGRSMVLTQAGRELVEHVRGMGELASRISLTASGQSQSVEGLVRITASDIVSAYVLPPILERIAGLAPGIEIEVVASNEINDLMRREADIAIRHVSPAQPDLIAKRCPDTRARLYAASSYLDEIGRPASGADLAGAGFIGFSGRNDELIAELNTRGVPVTMRNFRWTTTSALVAWAMVRQGLGIAAMMEVAAVSCPDVEVVWPGFEPIPVAVWLATHRELRTSRRIRLVFDLLGEMLSEPRVMG